MKLGDSASDLDMSLLITAFICKLDTGIATHLYVLFYQQWQRPFFLPASDWTLSEDKVNDFVFIECGLFTILSVSTIFQNCCL